MERTASTANLECYEQCVSGDVTVGADVTIEGGSSEFNMFREQATVPARPDQTLLNDDRVLRNMLEAEERYTPQTTCFQTLQKDVELWMRNEVANWMHDVRKSVGFPSLPHPFPLSFSPPPPSNHSFTQGWSMFGPVSSPDMEF